MLQNENDALLWSWLLWKRIVKIMKTSNQVFEDGGDIKGAAIEQLAKEEFPNDLNEPERTDFIIEHFNKYHCPCCTYVVREYGKGLKVVCGLCPGLSIWKAPKWDREFKPCIREWSPYYEFEDPFFTDTMEDRIKNCKKIRDGFKELLLAKTVDEVEYIEFQ